MTIKNVTSAFRATGICPFNRKASIVKHFEPSDVMKKSKVAYHPLYSPHPKMKTAHTSDDQEDSAADSDDHDSCDTDRCISPFPNLPSFGKHLSKYKIPELPMQNKPKGTGRVLTTLDNVRMLEEKEKMKKDKALEKEKRKEIQEEKCTAKLLGKSACTRGHGCGHGRGQRSTGDCCMCMLK